MKLFKNNDVKQAFLLGFMCTISYLGCYFARNVLSVISPQMIETGTSDVEFIGVLSTGYIFTYAAGQLLNGRIGDSLKVKYLVGGGLSLAGFCNLLLPFLQETTPVIMIYSLSGFFLSMIYAPIMRAVAENTLPVYAARCSLGFTIASFLGAPFASVVAMFFDWKKVFVVCGTTLILLGMFSFVCFTIFEKKGIVTYKTTQKTEKQKIVVKVLLERSVVRFALIAVLTGIVRTSVMFWVPTYLSQYLGLSESMATITFTIITLIRSASPIINVILIYDLIMKRNINRMLLVMFAGSAAMFTMMFFVSNPLLNILFLTLAVITSGGASNMVFSVYCPSLRDTGMVSTVTGFMDAMSYVAAALANLLFSNAIVTIGWGRLILIWAGIMFAGIFASGRVCAIRVNRHIKSR